MFGKLCLWNYQAFTNDGLTMMHEGIQPAPGLWGGLWETRQRTI